MKSEIKPPFAARVVQAMSLRGLTLRGFCRAAEIDPSFFSKVLAGKRSPPSDEAVLRKIAGLLGLDAAELIVSAGRIPAEWKNLWSDRGLFHRVHGLASGQSAPAGTHAIANKPKDVAVIQRPRPGLADELL